MRKPHPFGGIAAALATSHALLGMTERPYPDGIADRISQSSSISRTERKKRTAKKKQAKRNRVRNKK